VTLEQLLLFALFVLVPLFSFLRRLLERRRQGQARREATRLAPATGDGTEAVAPTTTRELRRTRPVRTPDLLAPAARPTAARRRARRPTLNSQDARRGVVLMTILGPPGGLRLPGGPR